MAKKKRRSAAQRAATKKMIAANKKHKHKGNPSGKKKKHKKHREHGHKRNPSEGIKKMGKGLLGLVMKGAEVGAGALLVGIVSQNVIPSSYRAGGANSSPNLYAGIQAGVGLGLGLIFERIRPLRRFADAVALGGVAMAVNTIASPVVLPPTAFNLLGEAYYLSELDSRRLTAVRQTLGELDQRSIVTQAKPAAMNRRAAIAAVQANGLPG